MTRSFAYSTASSKAACATPTAPAAVPGSREVERLHRDLEALALLADAVLGRNDDVGQRERGRVRRALAHLVEVLLDLDARRVHRDDERRDAAMALARIGLREDDRPGRVAGVRDERLRAVQDVLVATPLGRRLHPRDVGAGIGLAEPERAQDRLLEERRQPRLAAARPIPRGAPARRRGRWRGSTCRCPSSPSCSSSPTSMPSNAGRPRPPSDSGTWRFMSPSSCAFAITSTGCVERSSYSAAFGRISFSANSRASARSSFCSGVRANETPPATPVSTAGSWRAAPASID